MLDDDVLFEKHVGEWAGLRRSICLGLMESAQFETCTLASNRNFLFKVSVFGRYSSDRKIGGDLASLNAQFRVRLRFDLKELLIEKAELG